MKTTLLSIALLLGAYAITPAYGWQVAQDAKDAVKDGASATKKGVEKGTEKTTEATKKGYHKTKKAVKKGTSEVKEKTTQ
ncbi:MAG TPA: hypothetical protein VH601_23455 [Bryobacteraceae bacterium]|jgi:hypothetical protein